MFSVSTFPHTLPGYLLSEGNQSSSTSHRQKLTMQGTQSCSVRHRDRFQHKPSGHLQWLPQKLPAEETSLSTVQGGKASQARQPNLLRQAIEAASRVRHPAFLDTPPEKTSGVWYPTFPSKLLQASPTSYPVFLDTSSYLQRY